MQNQSTTGWQPVGAGVRLLTRLATTRRRTQFAPCPLRNTNKGTKQKCKQKNKQKTNKKASKKQTKSKQTRKQTNNVYP